MTELDQSFLEQQLHKKDQELQHLQELCSLLREKYDELKGLCEALFCQPDQQAVAQVLRDIEREVKGYL